MEYVLRRAVVEDAPVLARQRRLMFQAMGTAGEASRAAALEEVSREWIARELAAGTFHSWVVEHAPGDEVVAGCSCAR